MCERCGKQGTTTTVETKQGTQQTQLCAECVKIVVRPNTNFQVRKSDAEEWMKALIREKYNIPQNAEIDLSQLSVKRVDKEQQS